MARILGPLALLGWLAACSPGPAELLELATLERPRSPNTYLVCPQALTRATVDREPPVWPVDVATLERTWLAALDREPRVERLLSDPDRHRHLVVQRTRLLRFPDLVQLDVVAVPPDGATVCLYGRSVYGYADLGQNRRRIEDWLARITPPAAAVGDGAAPR